MGGVDDSGDGRTNLILSETFDDASSTIIIWMMRCHHYNSQFLLRMANGVAIGWHDCVQVDRTSLGRGGCVDGAGGWLDAHEHIMMFVPILSSNQHQVVMQTNELLSG